MLIKLGWLKQNVAFFWCSLCTRTNNNKVINIYFSLAKFNKAQNKLKTNFLFWELDDKVRTGSSHSAVLNVAFLGTKKIGEAFFLSQYSQKLLCAVNVEQRRASSFPRVCVLRRHPAPPPPRSRRWRECVKTSWAGSDGRRTLSPWPTLAYVWVCMITTVITDRRGHGRRMGSPTAVAAVTDPAAVTRLIPDLLLHQI